jgi:hypothetical protein
LAGGAVNDRWSSKVAQGAGSWVLLPMFSTSTGACIANGNSLWYASRIGQEEMNNHQKPTFCSAFAVSYQ